MKKIELSLTIIILSLTFCGCDAPRYYNYFITNDCDELIKTKIEVNHVYNSAVPSVGSTKIFDLLIEPNTTRLIISSEFLQPLNDKMIEYFLVEIIITKGIDTSKVNYVDKDLWEFKKTSKNHADFYLTVRPEDFENE